MDIPKYDGNIHPDEWMDEVNKYFKLKKINVNNYLEAVILFVDSSIKLPAEINSFEKLRKALKEDISFTVFKNTNKRKLQLLKYVPEKKGGDTSKFISNFRKLCYNAEINDIVEQTKYFCHSFPNDRFLFEFFKREEKISSMNDLFKKFEEIITEESNLIRNGFIVALKHVSTRKYLSSIKNLWYTTGSKSQLVFIYLFVFVHFCLL